MSQRDFNDIEQRWLSVLRKMPEGGPPADLDARILAAAQAQPVAPVRARSHLARRPWLVSAAALLLTTVFGGVLVLRNDLLPPPSAEVLDRAPPAAAPAPATQPSAESESRPAPAPNAQSESPDSTGLGGASTSAKSATAGASARVEAPRVAPPTEPTESTEPVPERAAARRSTQSQAPAQPMPSPAPEPSAAMPQAAASKEVDVAQSAMADAVPAQSKSRPMQSVDESIPPAEWLEQIRDLVTIGQAAAARVSLEAFVARYPDYPLPSDLQALLRDEPAAD